MAQHAVIGNRAASFDIPAPRRETGEWSPRARILSLVGCSLAAWVVVLAPLYFIG